MKKLKEWGDLNSWWLPWVGIIVTISSLIFPGALLKAGEILLETFQFLKKHWIYTLIVCRGVYTHFEIRKLKNGKIPSEKKTEKNAC